MSSPSGFSWCNWRSPYLVYVQKSANYQRLLKPHRNKVANLLKTLLRKARKNSSPNTEPGGTPHDKPMICDMVYENPKALS